MADRVVWTLEALELPLKAKERRMLGAMAAHWTRAAHETLSVSAGGASKRARAVRRTRGRVTRGPLGKVYNRFLTLPERFAALKKKQRSRHYADMLATEGDQTLDQRDFTPRGAAKAATDVYEKFRHSKPGEPPRKITGFGQRNVVWRYATQDGKLSARAGLFVNALYLYFLEVGFKTRFKPGEGRRGVSRVLPRPWMIRTLKQEMGALRQIVAAEGGKI